eukprot:CAMPEP_0202448326 /NCGR_PEP_ID=MMETSP1360-20130828/7150_1 /ASSEMBLY_ACC=CAM_ASM_000848 /TAXON_ID=515479 /ORGANISM="Licmophora paradoxa, Strain CCMP2313" /LENGTH=134 /DNA_ID=CAMNT_0049065847 /DNA_START=96 /DNA_END=501 /DNA_ORIENTATION=-
MTATKQSPSAAALVDLDTYLQVLETCRPYYSFSIHRTSGTFVLPPRLDDAFKQSCANTGMEESTNMPNNKEQKDTQSSSNGESDETSNDRVENQEPARTANTHYTWKKREEEKGSNSFNDRGSVLRCMEYGLRD